MAMAEENEAIVHMEGKDMGVESNSVACREKSRF